MTLKVCPLHSRTAEILIQYCQCPFEDVRSAAAGNSGAPEVSNLNKKV